jgi:hypothetical protein
LFINTWTDLNQLLELQFHCWKGVSILFFLSRALTHFFWRSSSPSKVIWVKFPPTRFYRWSFEATVAEERSESISLGIVDLIVYWRHRGGFSMSCALANKRVGLKGEVICNQLFGMYHRYQTWGAPIIVCPSSRSRLLD